MSDTDDRQLWTAVVAAQIELNACRAAFYQSARSPGAVLSAALQGSPNDQATALLFLGAFGSLTDHMELMPRLIELAKSDRSAMRARQAIAAARRDVALAALGRLVPPMLETADSLDYRRLAELLAHVRAWKLLGDLSRRALANADPDTREVGEDFADYAKLSQP